MTSSCIVERENDILIVTLNRPEKHNSLDLTMHTALERIWNDFYADEVLRVAILTGAGDKAFCAGSDMSMFGTSELEALGGIPANINPHGYAGLTRRFDASKPIIAAVNGYCLGGGFEVMLCCDLAVASENASFGLPEVRLGGAAMGGGIPRLARKLPFTRAMTLLLTGERIGAAQALEWGLVTEVTPAREVLAVAKDLARKIALGGPFGVQVSMNIMNAMLHGDAMDEVLRYEDEKLTRMVLDCEDSKEGFAAFFEKRAPKWRSPRKLSPLPPR